MKIHIQLSYRRRLSLGVLIATSLLASSSTRAAALPGSLKTFGSTNAGQLGNGQANTTNSLPQQITGGASNISAGYYHSWFLKTDGTLWAMGANTNGQLGD